MTEYRKPELALLGDAAAVIQGSKTEDRDAIPTLHQKPDCELDD